MPSPRRRFSARAARALLGVGVAASALACDAGGGHVADGGDGGSGGDGGGGNSTQDGSIGGGEDAGGSGADGGGGDAAPPADPSRVPLTQWQIQSSTLATDLGEVISTAAYVPSQWYSASVPSTVLGALVGAGVYTDVLSGMNLRSVPGTTYPIGKDFLSIEDNVPMPADSPFAHPWWYRTQFDSPAGSSVTLHFEGIDYRADIFLNGQRVAASADIAGVFRRFDFDVTKYLLPTKNTLAVAVTAQQPNELGLDFVDWNPAPPDRLMGLIREAYLVQYGGVEIRDPFVSTHLSGSTAALTVVAALHNPSAAAVQATLAGTIGSIAFQQDVTVPPGDSSATFDPGAFPQLNVANPRLWWPAKLGAQDMYTLDLELTVAGKVVHEQAATFGIREVTSSLSSGARLFQINGKPIFIRGAGYSPDILYRQDPARQDAELAYAIDLNLNTVRLEGKLEDEHFFDVADRIGLLVMPGLMCCDYWQFSKDWTASDFPVAAASVYDQALRLRRHPSVLTFLYGSDEAPVPQAEQGYLDAFARASWPNPVQSAASEPQPPPATGPTGFKMRGPYDYEPPIYWYTDTAHGGAFGFATEIGPGADVPPVESLTAMLGAAHLWPIDSVWDYHVGAKPPFVNLDNVTNALNGRYGLATGVDDYAMKSQLMAYESLRAMFEAYGRNKYSSATGVIQWMLNNAWPGLNWHLFDYYLRPAGAYFGAKKGNEYLHVQYSYDDGSVVVVNHLYQSKPGLNVTASLTNLQGAQLFSQSVALDAAADSSTKTSIVVPVASQASGVYFLDLELSDASGKGVSSNLYWLTPHADVMASPDPSTAWYFEPVATFADFTPLGGLPQVSLVGTKSTQAGGGESATTVTLQNPSSTLAFFTRVQVVTSAGQEVLPILWDDDYVSIPAGGTRTLTATYATSLAGGGDVAVKVSGWNVAAAQL